MERVLEALEMYHPIPLTSTDLQLELNIGYKTIQEAAKRWADRIDSFIGYGNQRYWHLIESELDHG